MQQDNSPHKNNRRIILVVTILVVFILAVVGTIVILNNATKNKSLPAASVVADYTTKAIPALSAKSYKQQIGIPSTIQYQLSGQSYSINVTTSKTILFFITNEPQLSDSSVVQGQTLTFMKQLGLKDTSSNWSTDKTIHYTTYVNSATVCQLVDSSRSTSSSSVTTHALACVDISDIKQEYALIEKLLLIYNKSQKSITFTQEIRNTESSGKVSFSIIDLTSKNKHYKLLFATAGSGWDYIGDLAAGDSKYASAKYIVTPEIKAKISNPKYNGFIVSQIH